MKVNVSIFYQSSGMTASKEKSITVIQNLSSAAIQHFFSLRSILYLTKTSKFIKKRPKFCVKYDD